MADVFRSLRHRNFRLYYAGQSVSLIGTWLQRLAVGWLARHIGTPHPVLPQGAATLLVALALWQQGNLSAITEKKPAMASN